MDEPENVALMTSLMPDTVEENNIPAVELELTQDEPELNYRPKFPLPDDINQLSREQTVCQYCGVSYLVLSEIKQLESRLERQSEELSHALSEMQAKEDGLAQTVQQNEEFRRQLEQFQTGTAL
ncbi:unnamed protein product [Echinostoma caproni]|uniref:Beclin-1 n=1 Tax=Echinostoma caproni TaxID=27848 RepID=A0A183B9V1_9TREM|nr:unnamed protein product [Echinostoma caproni]